MPQMAPMNWLFLFIYSILMLYLFSNLNYFINYKNLSFKSKINKNLKLNNWKW
uniref:ATP synthase F0 subunit 8 n=1 Tax=Semidalis macleodi TaxID=2919411 RepID=UPI001FA6DD9B|nr:ATP synthase F0 subunit 8 [Semidalis macleodi]ULR86825.1 ATP synthase F0 subunit 8 [Semidalis macleodi]